MADTIKVALAQTTTGADREANRVRAERMIAEAAEAGAHVVAFAEMGFDPFFAQHPCDERFFDWAEPIPGPTTQRFGEAAARAGLAVLVNIYERGERGQYFDTTAVLGADGALQGSSRMMHICETPGFHEKFYYWPGDTDFPVFRIGPARVAPAICYDRHFPEFMRTLTLRGAEVIIVQTATTREEAGQVLEGEMCAAALANGVWVALVNRAGEDQGLHFAGRSFVAAPDGSMFAQTQSDGDDLLTAELELARIDRARHTWPFLRDRRPEIYGPLLDDLQAGCE